MRGHGSVVRMCVVSAVQAAAVCLAVQSAAAEPVDPSWCGGWSGRWSMIGVARSGQLGGDYGTKLAGCETGSLSGTYSAWNTGQNKTVEGRLRDPRVAGDTLTFATVQSQVSLTRKDAGGTPRLVGTGIQDGVRGQHTLDIVLTRQ